MLIIGLTGSIGMGKSTTGEMLRKRGVPVHDSDRAVHELYTGSAREIIAAQFPAAVTDNAIDRKKLSEIVLADGKAMARLEQIIHPLVGDHRRDFLMGAAHSGARIAVCDIPLLFETGMNKKVDVVVVVSAPFWVQKQRVLGRAGMTEDRFHAILARQIPDSEKRANAHFVIDTAVGFEFASRQVDALLRACEPAAQR